MNEKIAAKKVILAAEANQPKAETPTAAAPEQQPSAHH
jgi:hypothetical protein